MLIDVQHVRMSAKNTTPCPHGIITGKKRACYRCQIARESPEVRARRLKRNLARVTAWNQANPEKRREKQRLYAERRRAKDPEKARMLERKYKGMPEPTRPEPAACESCGGPPKGKHKRLVVDHDHTTGVFRGWLCDLCNRGIGMLGDNTSGVAKALAYLERT